MQKEKNVSFCPNTVHFTNLKGTKLYRCTCRLFLSWICPVYRIVSETLTEEGFPVILSNNLDIRLNKTDKSIFNKIHKPMDLILYFFLPRTEQATYISIGSMFCMTVFSTTDVGIDFSC